MSKKVLLILVLLATLPVSADFKEGLKQTASILVGVPTGFFVGGVRGAVSKTAEYDSHISQEVDNTVAKVVAYPFATALGLAGGLVTGVTRGLVDAFYYGINDPFTAEAFSVEGSFLDYDPYDVVNYKDGTTPKAN